MLERNPALTPGVNYPVKSVKPTLQRAAKSFRGEVLSLFLCSILGLELGFILSLVLCLILS